jgi:hypothetical protein
MFVVFNNTHSLFKYEENYICLSWNTCFLIYPFDLFNIFECNILNLKKY